jgi:hypothetical protein
MQKTAVFVSQWCVRSVTDNCGRLLSNPCTTTMRPQGAALPKTISPGKYQLGTPKRTGLFPLSAFHETAPFQHYFLHN